MRNTMESMPVRIVAAAVLVWASAATAENGLLTPADFAELTDERERSVALFGE